jgi:hypothetical protein
VFGWLLPVPQEELKAGLQKLLHEAGVQVRVAMHARTQLFKRL